MTKIATVRVPGIPPFPMRVYADGDLHLSPSISSHGIWEPCQTQVFLRLIQSGETVLDVGANIGYYTLLASKLIGALGHVFAFEAERRNFDLLQENIQLNRCDNIVCEQAAVLDRAGMGRIHVHDENLGRHSMFAANDLTPSHEVRLLTLDDYFDNGDRRVDLVKIDTEGAEYKILCGMENLIEDNREHMRLIVEYAPRLLEAAGEQASKMNSKLRALFPRIMLIRETGLSVSEITFDDLDAYCEEALAQPRTAFTNLLCFASETSYQAAKKLFAD